MYWTGWTYSGLVCEYEIIILWRYESIVFCVEQHKIIVWLCSVNIVVVNVVLVPCIMFKFYFQDCEFKVTQVAETETKQKQKQNENILLGSCLAPSCQRTSSSRCWPAASWGSRRTHRSECLPGSSDHICHPSTTKIGLMELVGAVGQALWLLMAWRVVPAAVWSVGLACWSWRWCCWPCCCWW